MNMGRTPDVFNLSFVYKEDDDINDINDVISNNNLLDTSIDTTNDDDNEQNNKKRNKNELLLTQQFEWNSDRDFEEILDKIADGRQNLPIKHKGDVVKAQLLCLQGGYDVQKVKIRLTIEPYKPTPKILRLTRQNNTGSNQLVDGLYSLLKGCDLDSIEELELGEGVVRILGDCRERFKNVININLSNSQLTEVPVEITQFFPRLEVLKLNDNKLTDLPSLVNLKHLRELHCDNNQLTKIRTDLRENRMLEVISLKGNKLTKPVMDMKALSKVHTFHLYGNPVEYLPEMHHCKSLRCLSLVNVVVSANDDLTEVDVQIGDTNTSSYIPQAISGKAAQKGKAFSAFFTLVFRHSSCQHLLIATALAKIAREDQSNCVEIWYDHILFCFLNRLIVLIIIISATEGALQQMLTMLLTSDVNVIREGK
jgi:Leucine-rich repeat (LRR) protein